MDRGRLVVVQPLMVTTIVWALPLGHWLTRPQVVPRHHARGIMMVASLGAGTALVIRGVLTL